MKLKPPPLCTVTHILALAEIVHDASLDSKIRDEITQEKLRIIDAARKAKKNPPGAALYKLILIAGWMAATESDAIKRLESVV